MAIDTSGKWWKGSSPGDLEEYLTLLSRQESHAVHESRVCTCSCGSLVFDLEADDNEGVARRTCRGCKAQHFICDSGEYWAEAETERWRCIGCQQESMGANLVVGFSLDRHKSAVLWLMLGARCVRCGILESPAGWKVGYEPSLQLLDIA